MSKLQDRNYCAEQVQASGKAESHNEVIRMK